MSTTSQIIALSAPVAIEAGSPGKVASFEATIYSGGTLELSGWDLPVVIDLAGLENGNVLVANLDHDSSKRVGNFSTTNDGSTLKASGFASAATPYRDEVVASAKAGYTWQASVEVAPKSVEPIRAGETASINNREIRGPVFVTRRGVLKGFAFVSHGADDNTSVAIAAKVKRNKMSDFQSWAAECGLDTSLMTADQMASIRANYDGRADANDSDFAAVAPLIQASADPVIAEEKRLRQIEAACRGVWGDESEQVQTLKASAIGGTTCVDDLIQAMREIRMTRIMQGVPMAHTVRGARHNEHPQVIEAAFALAGGLSNPESHYSEQVLDTADKMRNSVSIQQLIMAEAMRRGYTAQPGERITQGNLRSVLQAAFAPEIRASGFSTNSLPTTLGNVANKFLRDGFESVDQTALRICFIKSVTNFKEQTTVSLTGGLTFSQVGPAGEIKHGNLGEKTYGNRADTYAVMLAIPRTDIINDDTSALTAAPRLIGRGGMLKLNNLVWTEFLNPSIANFWHADNNNVNTGVADMTLGGLEATETIFINQTDPDGNPLGVMPKILLVPPALKSAALTLMNSQLTVGGSSNVPNANIWQGRYVVESSPYMQNSSFTGSSAAAWYLLASPNQVPVIEIAALNGRVEPFVETADVDFSTLGIQMRGVSDVGVRAQEFRGGVRADGGSS